MNLYSKKIDIVLKEAKFKFKEAKSFPSDPILVINFSYYDNQK